MGGTMLGRPRRDPDLRLELAHERGGHRPHRGRVRGRARHGLICARERAARSRARVGAGSLGARDPRARRAAAWVRRRVPGLRRERVACAAATAGADQVASAHRQLRVAVERGVVGSGTTGPVRQLRRRSRRALVVRRCGGCGELCPGERHATRCSHAVRVFDARARERGRSARGRATCESWPAHRPARGRRELGRALRAARRDPSVATRRCTRALTRGCLGVAHPRRDAREGADRVDLRPARPQPPASRRGSATRSDSRRRPSPGSSASTAPSP